MRRLNPTPHTRSRARRSRGQTLIETALIFITLLSMILFIMDMSRILLMGQYATERARATARRAVVNNWDVDTARNYFCFNSTSAPSGSGSSTPGYLGIKPSQVNYYTLGTPNTPDHRVKIRVHNIQAFLYVPYIAGNFRLPSISVEVPAQSMGATN